MRFCLGFDGPSTAALQIVVKKSKQGVDLLQCWLYRDVSSSEAVVIGLHLNDLNGGGGRGGCERKDVNVGSDRTGFSVRESVKMKRGTAARGEGQQ